MAEVKNLRTGAETGLSALFEAGRKSFAAEEAIGREEAFKFFEATGLPSRRVEARKGQRVGSVGAEARGASHETSRNEALGEAVQKALTAYPPG